MTRKTSPAACLTMLARFQALEYLSYVALGRRPRFRQSEEKLNGRPCILMHPVAKSSREERVVLCVHGMSVYGYRDVRMLNVGAALAGLGYTAVIPSYPEIQELCISATSVPSIQADVAALGNHRRIGLLSASFSGGLSLIAASQPVTAPSVSSLLIVGTYCHVNSTMKFFLHRENADPYGLYIVLKNFLPYLGSVDQQLIQALDTAARDNGFQRRDGERQLGSFLSACENGTREEFQRLISDPAYRLNVWQRILDVPDARRAVEGLDVLGVIDGLEGTLCLLHGARDIVIPPEESVQLYERLRPTCRAALTVTSILDHGNVRLHPRVAGEFLSLLDTVSLFFRAMNA